MQHQKRAMNPILKRTNGINQKQPSRGVLMERCSENMQQFYRRARQRKATLLKSHVGMG